MGRVGQFGLKELREDVVWELTCFGLWLMLTNFLAISSTLL